MNISRQTSYKWDVAISLCKQDLDFARKLIKSINPTVKVFFYEERQDELISKSGPESFANIFKKESRVIVILSRNEWSETYYTEIERNAIIDRTAVKNEGYNFLMVIPMIQGEIPPWYPSTQIYVSPFNFSIQEIAHFIEFKVSEEGGIIKSLTLEDRYQNILNRIEEKKLIVQLQESNEAIEKARLEIIKLKDCFNDKSEFVRSRFLASHSWYKFGYDTNIAYLKLNDYLLECKILLPDELYHNFVTTQDFSVTFELFKTFGENEVRKSIEKEQRLFYYTTRLFGWSKQYLIEQATNQELIVLFRSRDKRQRYDLTVPINTIDFVDNWFQKLLSKSIELIERYI
ncbi:hypothetical protein HXX01_00200 [Candidatus Nomurabacteria bacterium]|nr:hypothetical protein [Candidatus Nomurabacteria bacterium]